MNCSQYLTFHSRVDRRGSAGSAVLSCQTLSQYPSRDRNRRERPHSVASFVDCSEDEKKRNKTVRSDVRNSGGKLEAPAST